jgi:hypothetical protein
MVPYTPEANIPWEIYLYFNRTKFSSPPSNTRSRCGQSAAPVNAVNAVNTVNTVNTVNASNNASGSVRYALFPREAETNVSGTVLLHHVGVASKQQAPVF